ncbi:hypothetical protein PFISCL1PPCAC_22424, partial [Pristionchus fissidentatus]
ERSPPAIKSTMPGSASKRNTKQAVPANKLSDPEKKEKAAKKKSNKQMSASPQQKPIMSPDKDKAKAEKKSNRLSKTSAEEKPKTSNRRSSTSTMTAIPKPITEKLSDENIAVKTSKAPSELTVSLSDAATIPTRSHEKKTPNNEEEKKKKRLTKELSNLKQKRIQQARKFDEKVTRCRTKGRPLMVGQSEARKEIERAETNLREWTKQFNQQMNALRESLKKEMGEIRNGMRELEEMEIKTAMESKHVRGAKCCRAMDSVKEE